MDERVTRSLSGRRFNMVMLPEERAMLSKGEAADLTRAVLEVLAMRVSAGEVRHLIRQLPEELAD